MLNQEEVVELRVRARRGEGIRALAQALSVSRNTVRRYLRGAEAGKRKAAVRRSKLDEFKAYLSERIEAARPDWIPATVLYREILERGYCGKLTTVKSFVRQFKPKPVSEPLIRFETAPGAQMQVDFVVFRRREPLLAFVATLGFSRASFVRFSVDERADTLLECLRAAFEFFGGVPAEILFDNAKSVVLARDAYGIGLHRFHSKLLELANSHGFVPRLCRPYRAKTKGKVERFNRFLRSSFYVPLATRLKSAGLVLDVHTANLEVQRWLTEVANVRLHGTTGKRPADLLGEERTQLLPLPISVAAQNVPRVSNLPLPTESIQHPLSIYAELLELEALP